MDNRDAEAQAVPSQASAAGDEDAHQLHVTGAMGGVCL